MIFVFLFLASLCVTGSSFIHLTRTKLNVFLLWLSNIPLHVYVCIYIYHDFFIHSSVYGYLGCFHVLVIVNSTAMNIGVHMSKMGNVSQICVILMQGPC